MNTLHDTGKTRRRHKGQTLAEFALTLPILLMLTFGIIEFGRIFQAWVTLQNSARAAVRYASTGQFYDDKFPMKLKKDLVYSANNLVSLNDPDSTVPCVDDGTDAPDGVVRSWSSAATDQRGTKVDYYPPGHNGDPKYKIGIYDNGLESIFASWNDGKNCDPRSADDQETRKDMLRVLSIFEEARKGAGGLALEQSSWTLPPTKTTILGTPWAAVWIVPNPRESLRSWFDVVVCSTRGTANTGSVDNTYYARTAADGSTNDIHTRFVTYVDNDNLRVTKTGDPSDGSDLNSSATSNPRLPQAGCLLNEFTPSPAPSALDNSGKPWLDPGGPGDTVTVVVTFNHPLITPIGLAPYIKMQARRSAIVESFRASSADTAFGDVPALEVQPNTNTPVPSFTPSITPTPSNTPTVTPVSSVTPSWTPPPAFSCNLITAKPVPNGVSDGVFGNTVSIDIKNDNVQATYITRVILKWPTILDYPGMYLTEMALDGAPHWKGTDQSDVNSATNTTDTNTDASTPANYFQNTPQSDRTVAARDTGNWTGLFGNGPILLQQYVSISNFAGTIFYMYNPLTPSTPCAIPLNVPPPTSTPPFNPNNPTNTPTFTPDCASNQLSVNFIGFEQFGIVRLEVVNNRYAVAGLTDFSIVWRQPLPGIITLDRVTTVAPYGQPGSVEVWHSTGPTADGTPPTGGHVATDGVWVQNFTFPPRSTTALLIDFGGVSGLLSDSNIGMTPSDFNGTQFRIGCGGTGGTGNGGGGNSGLINLANAPTPAPTNTPGPSNTPKPTYTPAPTNTPAPATKTFTPGPTSTPKPTNTPKPPPTATTPPPPPTLPGGGCGDGCG
ncbi:MAG: TadE/TadG family type IV pilus assembly protein [Chloroflexota bacterium]